MYDFIIVGARCAGAATAILLAKQGYRICLIDQYSAPGPTLSTHIIGETAIYERLHVHNRLTTSGIPEMTRMRVDIEGRVLESNISVTPRALSVRRELLDGWLLEETARFPHVDILLETKVSTLIKSGNKTIGVHYKRKHGEAGSLYANVVIGADGRNSVIAHSAGAQTMIQSNANHLAVYYAYLRELEPLPIPTVEWYWSNDSIILCNPLDQQLHCIAVMLPQDSFKQWGTNPASFYLERLRQIQTLAPRMNTVQWEGHVRGVGNLSSYIRMPYGDQWALVGDAGAHLHPVSGTGIDNAVCTAEILADELHFYMKREKSWQEAMNSYTGKRDDRILPQYHHCLKTLARSAHEVDSEALRTLDVLCTFPSLVKELGHRAPDIYSTLLEGVIDD